MGEQSTVTAWTNSSANYNKGVQGELAGKEVAIWSDLIQEHLPYEGTLRVLDIGTGPGFFTILLSKMGHYVTGIDVTPSMLENAKINAKNNGVEAEFRVMNCHDLEFEDNTFDLIISRNVTWTLYDPIKAYKGFLRVLKPGGRLLIFDANWYMNFFDEKTDRILQQGMEQYRKEYGAFPPGFKMNLKYDYWTELPLPGVPRPAWDKATCFKLGYENFFSEEIDARVTVDRKSRLLYGCTPMFVVRADKPKMY